MHSLPMIFSSRLPILVKPVNNIYQCMHFHACVALRQAAAVHSVEPDHDDGNIVSVG